MYKRRHFREIFSIRYVYTRARMVHVCASFAQGVSLAVVRFEIRKSFFSLKNISKYEII